MNGEEKNRPVSYYAEKYAGDDNELKQQLNRFVPVESNFKESWRKANAAISQERNSKKLQINTQST